MPDRLVAAVVGAGPFGLSVAAWLDDRPARVYGSPMQTWRTCMPPAMLMRSAWDETSLSARGGRGSIDEFVDASAETRQEPIPLQLFLRYAEWFRNTYVRESDPDDVRSVETADGGFRVMTDRGEWHASTVVVAVGATPFARTPPQLANIDGDRVTFATSQNDFARFAGRRVVVVGAGQSGLESAALAAAAGADVELLARSGVRWFADHEPHRRRSASRARLYRLAYPVVGYGPPPLNRLVSHPDLFAALPWPIRRRLNARILRPGGSPYLRAAVDGHVRVTAGLEVTRAEEADGVVRLDLSDGTVREADHVLLATGYRFDLDRLPWLDGSLRSRVAVEHRWPVLDRTFQTTVPGLRFVGYPAEGRFGPSSRFVLGAEFAARRVASATPR